MATRRIAKEIEAALNETGLEWRIVNGGRHCRIMTGPHQLAALSYGGKASRDFRSERNAIGDIRRNARKIREQQTC